MVAWACAGGGYETSWDPQASTAILSPANDTRTNLVLLLADRDGTMVADPRQMTQGIVPFDFPYSVLVERLAPPEADNAGAGAFQDPRAVYGLSGDEKTAFAYESNSLGLCHSNGSGAEQFAAAVTADAAVPAAEKAKLVAVRRQLAQACDKAAEMRFDSGAVISSSGTAYAHYLQGTRLFYAEDFPAAAAEFTAVGKPASAWLAETAAYMQFRTALAEAMKGSIGEWGEIADPDKRDRAAIDAADVARQHFLAAFPNGRYAASARNFERRIAWLRNDTPALARSYSAMVAAKEQAGSGPDQQLIAEIDRRLLPSRDGAGVSEPMLLAVVDLMRLRPTPDYDKERTCCGSELGQAELESQRPLFRTRPELFGYLLAAEAFYRRHQPRAVLALIPDAAHQKSFGYVEFSRQVLRGLALDAVNDPNARSFWMSLLPGAVQPYQRATVELAILKHDRAAGIAGRLLETGSPILHPLIRQAIIEKDAGQELLRRQAQSGTTNQQREVALYLLLGDELHHGLYRQFLADQAMVGQRSQPTEDNRYRSSFWSVDNYEPNYLTELSPPPLYIFAGGGSGDLAPCPDILTTAKGLEADPSAVRPRLCLAEFIRREGLDGWGDSYAGDQTVLRARNGFAGRPLQRMDIYRAVMDSPAASADDKAFALNRAIRCFQPAGYSSCNVEDIPVSTRKAWFDRLKSEYPGSPWARELKYYW
jgi:hypothetical protein